MLVIFKFGGEILGFFFFFFFQDTCCLQNVPFSFFLLRPRFYGGFFTMQLVHYLFRTFFFAD